MSIATAGSATAGSAVAAPPRAGHSATRRTLLALLACALGALPLKSLLSDNRWIVDAWLAMIIVLAPAALLRLRRPPSALDIWPGVILLVPWLTHLYLPVHAWGGFFPTRATFGDIGDLMNSLHHTTSDEVAPIHSTVAVRLVISALLGLLAALIDLIAVVGRRGALAGMPLLVVYTVSGAVPRSPVSWFWFCAAAVAYLILLALDAADELHNWGRRVPRPGAAWSRQGLAFSAQRIGIVAIVVAVVLPLVAPSQSKNLLAELFRGSGKGGIGSFGANSGGTSISPFAELKGQLERDHPVHLMDVHIDGGDVQPFYVRSNVLDKFTGGGWTVSDHGTKIALGGGFPTLPATGTPTTVSYTATIRVSLLSGNAPIFGVPQRVVGLSSDTTWSQQDQLLLDTSVSKGDQYFEVVQQPQPTLGELNASFPVSNEDTSRWLQLPPLPPYVTDLVNRLTSGQPTQYQKAKAIFDWFADPANGFVYSLKTTKGDSGSDLVDFLQHRKGFCQQYAAAMGVMLRAAGVPARLVLGYMHPAPNAAGDFAITTFDAHAWVEAYFAGVGWVPFDPTPTAGLVGGKQTDLAWARHHYSGTLPDGRPSINSTSPAPQHSSASAGSTSGALPSSHSASTSYGSLIWTALVVLVVAGIALIPAGVRGWRRRSRLAAARRGDTDALWTELSDTAVDLGYVWSPARSPRQVSAWLAKDAAGSAPALDALAVAVEQRRYAPAARPQDTGELARGLVEVTGQLWSRRSGKARLRARLWPASLGWGRRWGGMRGRLRRTH